MPAGGIPRPEGKAIDVSAVWTITSFEGRNAPSAPLSLARLSDWGKSDDPKLRYFAGRAFYEKTVEGVGGRVTLDLGEVHEIANILPNRLIGDTIALRDGAKEEKSRTSSLPRWVVENRPDSGTGVFSWSNFRSGWTADDAPLPSGLLGPVVLRCADK